MKTVRFTAPADINGRTYGVGERLDCPDGIARKLLASGVAEDPSAPRPAPVVRSAPKPASTPSGMVKVRVRPKCEYRRGGKTYRAGDVLEVPADSIGLDGRRIGSDHLGVFDLLTPGTPPPPAPALAEKRAYLDRIDQAGGRVVRMAT